MAAARGAAAAEAPKGDEAGEQWWETSEKSSKLAADLEKLGRSLRDPVSFSAYYFVCFVGVFAISMTAIICWSAMGFGNECLLALMGIGHWGDGFIVVGLSVMAVLYLLDFFCPPHSPGRHCKLSAHDKCLGPSLLAVAVGALAIGIVLKSPSCPWTPLLLHTFLTPTVVLGIRFYCLSRMSTTRIAAAASADVPFQNLVVFIKKAHDLKEHDQCNFFKGASAAFVSLGLVGAGAWIPWVVRTVHDIAASDVSFILWVAPLVISISNVVFGMIIYLRVFLSVSYSSTHQARSSLAMANSAAAGDGADLGNKAARARSSHGQLQRFLRAVKIIGCVAVVQVGSTYIVFQLVPLNSTLSSMCQVFSLCYLIFFCAFTLLSFMRVWKMVRLWESPLLRKLHEFVESNAFRASAVAVLLPVLPFALALAAVNQLVRRARGLADAADSDVDAESGGKGASPRPIHATMLTARMTKVLDYVQSWLWMPVIWWIYVLSLAFIITALTPRLLNIFLAWLKFAFEGFNFWVLLVVTLVIGLVMFLLPPVPGAPVYFFAGALFTQACPWGFWPGALISVAFGWVLKLLACAMEQVLIGERLGNFLWVQQACGVHKPFIRTIELVLRRPGLGLGKVAILCGGPDWPTSVLAGILRLSLFQMELGTTPIIFFVAPFSLSGSFYLRRGEGEFWSRLGDFMFSATALVCVVLWAIMAWAWQAEFDRSFEEVTRPMAKYVNLDWLDYRAEKIRERIAFPWRDVPKLLQIAYLAGALATAMIAQGFFWGLEIFFDSFAVTDDIHTLVWYGQTGFVKPAGVIGLFAVCASSCWFFCFGFWRRRHVQVPAAEAARELDTEEVDWKERRLEEVARLDTLACQESSESSISMEAAFFQEEAPAPSKETRESSAVEHSFCPTLSENLDRALSGAELSDTIGRALSVKLDASESQTLFEAQASLQKGNVNEAWRLVSDVVEDLPPAPERRHASTASTTSATLNDFARGPPSGRIAACVPQPRDSTSHQGDGGLLPGASKPMPGLLGRRRTFGCFPGCGVLGAVVEPCPGRRSTAPDKF